MIPIRDTVQSKNYPVVNNIIIAANVMLYLIQLTQGDRLNQFIITYGLVPARYSVPQIAAYFTSGQQVLSFFSFIPSVLPPVWISFRHIAPLYKLALSSPYNRSQRGHRRGYGSLLTAFSQGKGPYAYPYFFYPLFY